MYIYSRTHKQNMEQDQITNAFYSTYVFKLHVEQIKKNPELDAGDLWTIAD
jgi:hypothetical protein